MSRASAMDVFRASRHAGSRFRGNCVGKKIKRKIRIIISIFVRTVYFVEMIFAVAFGSLSLQLLTINDLCFNNGRNRNKNATSE